MTDRPGHGTRRELSTDGLEFVNWMAADDFVALGRLHGRMVTLVGVLGPHSGSVVDGSFGVFGSTAFTPPVANTDTAYVVGGPADQEGHTFTLLFGGPVRDPVLHLHSLGSTLTFPDGSSVRRLSGDPGFVVVGTTVTGGGQEQADADGTVQLVGVISTLRFSARSNSAGGSVVDGIYLQVGAWQT
jgi:hypothetical protein